MKNLLLKSANILNSNIVLVLLVGIFNIQILFGVMTYISLLGIATSFLLTIIVYGRAVAKIQGLDAMSALEILKANWLNYIIVVISLSLPIFLYSQLSKLFSMPTELSIYSKEGVNLLVNILTIYVLPIVFIKKRSLLAIIAGVVFFVQKLKKSAPLIFLVVSIYFINKATISWLIQQVHQNQNILSLLPVMIPANIVVTYFSFLIFTAACVVLIPSPLEGTKN